MSWNRNIWSAGARLTERYVADLEHKLKGDISNA